MIILKAEYRTLTQKGVEERRNEIITEMEGLVNAIKAETRAFNAEEANKYEELKKELRQIDTTLVAMEENRGKDIKTPEKRAKEDQRVLDEENFLKFVRGEERALDIANNGAIIPVTIADRIIEKVKEISPIYKLATIYNVNGDLVFPVYDDATPIQAKYVDDLEELTEQTGKFTKVTLTNHIVGVLAKVSNSLMNRTDFDVVSYVINKVAEAISEFLEKEFLIGTEGKMSGVFTSATQVVVAKSDTAITADDIIDLQDAIPDKHKDKGCFIMSKKTRGMLRKLKDQTGQYLLQKDLTNGFGYSILGNPVYVSESCDEVAAGKPVIAYGDMSGLYGKLTKGLSIQVLKEKFATQYATGVVAYVEADSKLVEPQKVAVLKMKSAG